MEKSTAGTNKRSPDGLSHPNRNTIITDNLVIFYKKWIKYNEIQLAKNKMDLNNRKVTNHPPSRFSSCALFTAYPNRIM